MSNFGEGVTSHPSSGTILSVFFFFFFKVWLKSQSSNSLIGSRRHWLLCACTVVLMHLLFYEGFLVVVCIVLLAVWLCMCFQLIEVVTTHPCAPSLSQTHKHTCMLVSSNDPLTEPDRSISFCLFLGPWNKFWQEFGLHFSPQHILHSLHKLFLQISITFMLPSCSIGYILCHTQHALTEALFETAMWEDWLLAYRQQSVNKRQRKEKKTLFPWQCLGT